MVRGKGLRLAGCPGLSRPLQPGPLTQEPVPHLAPQRTPVATLEDMEVLSPDDTKRRRANGTRASGDSQRGRNSRSNQPSSRRDRRALGGNSALRRRDSVCGNGGETADFSTNINTIRKCQVGSCALASGALQEPLWLEPWPAIS
ncbi:unnamed protein product [Lota lota]